MTGSSSLCAGIRNAVQKEQCVRNSAGPAVLP
jgi:hypothetical protein